MKDIKQCIFWLKSKLYSNQGLAFLCGMFISLVGANQLFNILPNQPSQTIEVNSGEQALTSGDVNFMPESLPIRIRIPSLSIDAPFMSPLGLNKDGTVAIPDFYDRVGLYKYGPTPGQMGPAVVFGHVDSYEGPAIFFYLYKLAPGDDIFIDREDGLTTHFIVTGSERYPQSEFPTEKVYADTDYAALRLITCTGIY